MSKENHDKLDHDIPKLSIDLANYFKSRNIGPADAAISMIRLIAMQLTFHNKDVAKLQKSISNINLLLTMDVALFLLPEDKIPQDNTKETP